MPVRPTHLGNSRAKILSGQTPIVLTVEEGGVAWTSFLSSFISLFFLPLSVDLEVH